MAVQVPRQFPDEFDADTVETQAVTLKYVILAVMIVIFAISIKLKASMENLWNMFFTLQMAVYMDVFNTATPANVVICIQQIKELIDFNFINPERIMHFWLPDFKLSAWIKGVSSTVITSPDQLSSIFVDNIVYFTIISFTIVAVFILALFALIFKNHRENVVNKLC